MKYIYMLFIFVIAGCQTVGVIETNDPIVKINDGYALLQARRTLPAFRLFNEALEISENTNESVKAKALVALGDLHKYKDGGSQSEGTYSIKKSILRYQEAESVLQKLKFNQRLSMVYWGLSQSYELDNNSEKSCEYLNKAAKSYFEASGGADDQLNQNVISSLIPAFEYSKTKNFNAKCKK